jgi:hypothetical protein
VEADEELRLVEAPYLTFPSKSKFTLVLDLDETLVHYYEVFLFPLHYL